jgi:hypothetical protein
MYFDRTSSEVSKSLLQVQDKATSGTGYLFKTLNNEVVFMQNTSGIKSEFDKVVVVAFEKEVDISIDPGDINYVDAIYFKDKRSLILHSKKNNTIYLLGLNEIQSKDKIELLRQNPNLKTKGFKIILGYGISVLSGKWNFDKFIKSGSFSAFDGLEIASTINRNINKNGLRDPNKKECTSGGEGATSCSIGSWPDVSCSVSCGDGYYACCNSSTTTCYCKKVAISLSSESPKNK